MEFPVPFFNLISSPHVCAEPQVPKMAKRRNGWIFFITGINGG